MIQRMMKMARKNRKGFTLVELMVVVLIIGILVAIAIPIYNAATSNSQEKACFANERTIEGAAEQFKANEAGHAYPATIAALVPSYIKATPVCPAGGTYSWNSATATATCSTHGHY